MKTIIGIALALLCGAAHAQTSQFFDARGMPAGRAETRGNQTQFYDRRGMPDGRAETFGNRTQLFDRRGMPGGSIEGAPMSPWGQSGPGSGRNER